MQYEVISADCHIDLIWMPPELFTENARPSLQSRMPFVIDTPEGPTWVASNGARFGLMNGMGSAGRPYVPGEIHRSDRMAETGLYEDGRRGIRRLTDPELRLADQDRDGVQAEVLYGILGAAARIGDPEAAEEMLRIYNDWLAEFVSTHPDRLVGIACIPNHSPEAAVAEILRVAERGAVRGVEIAGSYDMKPLYEPWWDPIWRAVDDTGLPLHFHTIGSQRPDTSHLDPARQRQAFACLITGFQMAMARVLMEAIFGCVFKSYPNVTLVLGESGIGWIPYVLDHMDHEWRDAFQDIPLDKPPSEYWRSNCRATYQTDKVGIANLEFLGAETIMWGSDFPHPDGIWPDSRAYIERELGHLPSDVRHRIVCGNAAQLYGLKT